MDRHGPWPCPVQRSPIRVQCQRPQLAGGGGSNASGAIVDVQWKSNTEKQLRDAIAEAPANGLKPELFLKGGESGTALTDAASNMLPRWPTVIRTRASCTKYTASRVPTWMSGRVSPTRSRRAT